MIDGNLPDRCTLNGDAIAARFEKLEGALLAFPIPSGMNRQRSNPIFTIMENEAIRAVYFRSVSIGDKLGLHRPKRALLSKSTTKGEDVLSTRQTTRSQLLHRFWRAPLHIRYQLVVLYDLIVSMRGEREDSWR